MKMFGKDEKGYVLSGFGLLLLIPVMIIIPTVLSVQDQSSTIPNAYVKSDTVFQTVKNIENDINDKTNNFTNSINKKVYTNSSSLSTSINLLYSSTSESVYKNAFDGTDDLVSITPNSTASLIMGNETGFIPLKNGIQLSYNYTGQQNVTNELMYAYTMNVVINIKFNIVKSKVGNNKNFYATYTPVTFYLSSSTNPTTFFDNLKTNLNGYNIIQN